MVYCAFRIARIWLIFTEISDQQWRPRIVTEVFVLGGPQEGQGENEAVATSHLSGNLLSLPFLTTRNVNKAVLHHTILLLVGYTNKHSEYHHQHSVLITPRCLGPVLGLCVPDLLWMQHEPGHGGASGWGTLIILQAKYNLIFSSI